MYQYNKQQLEEMKEKLSKESTKSNKVYKNRDSLHYFGTFILLIYLVIFIYWMNYLYNVI